MRLTRLATVVLAGLLTLACGAPRAPQAAEPPLPGMPRTPGENTSDWRPEILGPALSDATFCGDDTVLVRANGAAWLWEVPTGRMRARFSSGTNTYRMVASCSRDGSRVVTAEADVRLWDRATGAVIRQWPLAEPPITSAMLSPRGARLATHPRSGPITVWDVDTGTTITVLETQSPQSMRFSPDGTQLAVVEENGPAIVFDTRTGAAQHTFRHPGRVAGADFLPDSKQLVTMSDDALHFWDLARGARVHTMNLHTPGKHVAVTFALSPDGARVVVTGGERGAAVLELETGNQVARVTVPVQPRPVSYSPDGAYLVSPTSLSLQVWSAETGEPVTALTRRVNPMYRSFAFERGRFVATGLTMPNTTTPMWTWDLRADQPTTVDEVPIRGLTVDSHGACLTWADENAWQWAPGCTTRAVEYTHTERIHRADRAPQGCVVLGGFEHLTLHGDCGVIELPEGATHAAGFSADGRRLLVTQPEPALLDRALGKRRLRSPADGVTASRFVSPDGHLVAGSADGTAWIWSASSGRVHARVRHDGRLVDVTKDGRRMLFVGKGFHAVDVATGRALPVFRTPPDLRWVGFASGGARVITAHELGAYVWDPETGRELAQLLWFPDHTWAVLDAEGRFDCSTPPPSAVVFTGPGHAARSLDDLRSTHHDPGLLQKILGYRDEPLRNVGVIAVP